MKTMKFVMKSASIRRAPRGAALLVGVVMLIILSLFVLGAMRDVLLQERMSGAFRNNSLAINTSQSVGREGERNIFDQQIALGGAARDAGGFGREGVGGNANANTFRASVGYPTAVPGAVSPLINYSGASGNTLARTGTFFIEGPAKMKVDGGAGVIDLTSHNSEQGQGVVYRLTSKATGGTVEFVRTIETSYVVMTGESGGNQ